MADGDGGRFGRRFGDEIQELAMKFKNSMSGEIGLCVVALLAVWLGGIAPANAADGYGCRQGYRQSSVIRDVALGQEWTVYSSCVHPETPRIAVMAYPPVAQARRVGGEAEADVPHALPAVRAGDRIRLWLRSPVAQVDLSAIALENGAAGATIRVRVEPGGTVLRGAVRSAESVELGAGDGFRGAGQ
jgi:hypothetical protein